jgi:hypothetical protein
LEEDIKVALDAKRAQPSRLAQAAPPPRICMPTWRGFNKNAYRCGLYEAQDVLVENDDVDLVQLEMGWGAWFSEASLRRPLYHDVSRRLIYANPGLKKVRLARDYDAFIVVCDTWADIPCINAIERWRDHCRVSICWIDEMWAAEIPKYKHWLHALGQFDYVFVGFRGTASPLSEAAGRPCHWLPRGVDALRFTPFPDPPDRVIDVYSIGRRRDGVHSAMLREAERRRLFYVHDTTINGANAQVNYHWQHRNHLANLAKRSRYFTVAPGKMDEDFQSHGQVEVGSRYYEGAAAGTVMIGETANCESYRELFGWPEVVVEIRPDGSDLASVLDDLDRNPERVAAIGGRNAAQSLRRHDWIYRWIEMFRIAGIEPSHAMMARARRLKEMADLVDSDGRLRGRADRDRAGIATNEA